MTDRRRFLRSLFASTAAIVVAPTSALAAIQTDPRFAAYRTTSNHQVDALGEINALFHDVYVEVVLPYMRGNSGTGSRTLGLGIESPAS